jgi:hypothetical protein
MSSTDRSAPSGTEGPRRKHRHDLGHEDHGAQAAAGTTRAIQVLLAMWIAATAVLVVSALVDAARPKPALPAPAAATTPQ